MNRKCHDRRALAAAAAMALSVPSLASAASAPPWQFAAALHGRFPTLGGTTTLPPGGGASGAGTWRVLDYRMKSGSAIEDLDFNGPGVAAVFRW